MDRNATHTPPPKPSGRTITNFNDGWRFCKLAITNGVSRLPVEAVDFDDSAWEAVTLPHTWNAASYNDPFSGNGEASREGYGCTPAENSGYAEGYYRGVGAYRKNFYFSGNEYGGRKIFLEFKGANTITELFVNEKPVGKHEGGYSTFRFDITEYVKLDSNNIILVEVNNAPTDFIAPITNQGDFTKMGGIYRDVNLITVASAHIDLTDHGSSGIYITPENISKNHTDIDIMVQLSNDASKECHLLVTVQLFGMDNTPILSKKSKKTLPSQKKSCVKFVIPLENPILWDGTNNPYLYTAKITLSSSDGILDECVQPFGIRSYLIDPEKGFFLNGHPLELRGVNYHQDSFENGWAMTDQQRARDYNMIREMGCTSVRMAHYQHDSYEYDLCDQLGLTVWTEVGIVNKMSANEKEPFAVSEKFFHNAKQQLTELIRQNYNHPSIIVWGLSNELYQMSDEIFTFYAELEQLAKNEDKSRLTTFADAQFWGKFLTLPADVVGYNRYFGWYHDAGSAKEFGAWLDCYHTTKESRPICISEYGGGAAISQFKDNINWRMDIDPWGHRHYQNYQSEMHEIIWAQLATRKYLWAKYIWCMFDFASAGRCEGDTKGQNDKGLVTRKRIPKDAFYFYKSIWNNTFMLHLTEKGFSPRPSMVPKVKAYTNAERAELFVNGISQGILTRENLRPEYPTVFVWENIKIHPGIGNKILVTAVSSSGENLSDSTVWIGMEV